MTAGRLSLVASISQVAHHAQHDVSKQLATGCCLRPRAPAIRAVAFLPELTAALAHLMLPDAKTLRYRAVPGGYAARILPLPIVKQIAKASRTKVNDVVLAICSGALRAYLQGKRAATAIGHGGGFDLRARYRGAETASLNGMLVCSLAGDRARPRERSDQPGRLER